MTPFRSPPESLDDSWAGSKPFPARPLIQILAVLSKKINKGLFSANRRAFFYSISPDLTRNQHKDRYKKQGQVR